MDDSLTDNDDSRTDNVADENTSTTRVDYELPAQNQAGFMAGRLEEIRFNLRKMPRLAEDVTDHNILAQAYLCDSISLLEGMQSGLVTKGNARAASNVIKAAELLAESGAVYEIALFGLHAVLLRLSQHGLAIDGFPLTDQKHIDRLKG